MQAAGRLSGLVALLGAMDILRAANVSDTYTWVRLLPSFACLPLHPASVLLMEALVRSLLLVELIHIALRAGAAHRSGMPLGPGWHTWHTCEAAHARTNSCRQAEARHASRHMHEQGRHAAAFICTTACNAPACAPISIC